MSRQVPDDADTAITRTPPEFAQTFGVNQQNVYYWIRKHGLGHKDESGRWQLSADDQRRMLALEKKRAPAKKFAKHPQAKPVRKRATESVDSIRAKLSLDRETAKLVNLLLNSPYNDALMDAVESLYAFRAPDAVTFKHERLLLIVAHVLGKNQLGQLVTHDGPVFFKYVEPDNPGEWTVVYNVWTQVFYVDRVDQILKKSRDLSARSTVFDTARAAN